MTDSPAPSSSSLKHLWCAIGLLAIFLIFCLVTLFALTFLPFVIPLASPCFFLPAGSVIVTWSFIILLKESKPGRKLLHLAAILAALIGPVFFAFDGRPYLFNYAWRLEAARTIDLAELRTWASDYVAVPPAGTPMTRGGQFPVRPEKIPVQLRAFTRHFEVYLVVPTPSPLTNAVPYVMFVTSGGFKEMSQGFLVGAHNLKPADDHVVLIRWEDGIFFFFQ